MHVTMSAGIAKVKTPQRRFTDAPQVAQRRATPAPCSDAPTVSARRLWLVVLLSWVAIGLVVVAIKWATL